MSRYGVLTLLSVYNKRVFHYSMLFLASRKLAWKCTVRESIWLRIGNNKYILSYQTNTYRYKFEFTRSEFSLIASSKIFKHGKNPLLICLIKGKNCWIKAEMLQAITDAFIRFDWDKLEVLIDRCFYDLNLL